MLDTFRDNITGRIESISDEFRTAALGGLIKTIAKIVVSIDNRHSRRSGAVRFKQFPLRRGIGIHRTVIVEMIARQIRKYGNVIVKPVDTALLQRMRRDFHYHLAGS